LTTSLGGLDLLGEITGGGTYDDLVAESDATDLLGSNVRRLSLGQLIAAKRAAGRPKDLVALSELEALMEERDRGRRAGPPLHLDSRRPAVTSAPGPARLVERPVLPRRVVLELIAADAADM
jgi:hypothetical protein